MTSVPVFRRLAIEDYEMYPGKDGAPGIARDFTAGTTLIIGANGLGKTTLVTLLRDLVVGPTQLVKKAGESFGAGKLDLTDTDRHTFAARVHDRAQSAWAEVEFDVNGARLVVARSLANLSLRRVVVNGQDQPASEEDYRREVIGAAAIGDYADWVLLLDYLVFVTEDKMQPLWDKNAQRHLLRVLLNDPATSLRLAELEGQHISLDSDYRNTRVFVNRQRKRVEEFQASLAQVPDLVESLTQLASDRDRLDANITALEDALEPMEAERSDALRERAHAQSLHQERLTGFERLRLQTIERAFPDAGYAAQFILARVVSDRECLFCLQDAPEFEQRTHDHLCVLCGRPLARTAPDPLDHDSLSRMESAVEEAAEAANAAEESLRKIDDEWALGRRQLADLKQERVDTQRRIEALQRRLPVSGDDVRSRVSALEEWETDLAGQRSRLDESRRHLEEATDAANEVVQERQASIKTNFDRFASRFLVEQCHLVPHSTALRIGQEGARFSWQVFDIDMTSGTSVGEARRTSRYEVSESQRIYLDIAFRVSLILACAAEGVGTVVVDAPEGSLDAVFAGRAADLLTALVAPGSQSRLVVASNLIEGSLLPALMRAGGVKEPEDDRLIDLLELAAPTAAVERQREQYRAVRNRLLHSAATAAE